jgi:hypothetical protein
MKQKWFWATLVFWTLSASSIVCWALISSPLRFQPQIISRYETKVNGQSQKTELWINQGRLTDLMPIIVKEFTTDHWKPLGNGLDLTSALLGSISDSFDLSDQIQVKLFQKNGLYRTLGLWQSKDTDETYGMTSEAPNAIFNLSQAKSNWGFPFPPPPSATQLFYEKLETLKIGFIYLPPGDAPVQQFNQICSSKGFSQILWQKENNKKIYILSDKKIKILAILNFDAHRNTISLVEIKS